MTDRAALLRAIKRAAAEKAYYMALGRSPGADTYQEAIITIAEHRLELLALIREISEYTGEGPPTTPWQNIVRGLSAKARTIIAEVDGAAS